MIHYKKGALIYVEPFHNVEFNNTIVENYDFILHSFNTINIPFIYLPKLLADSHFNRVLEYNHPHIKDSRNTHTNKLYHVISNNLNLSIDGPTLIHLLDNGDVAHQFNLPSFEVLASDKRLSLFTEEIRHKISPVIKDEEGSMRFRMGREEPDLSFDLQFDSLEEFKPAKLYTEKKSLDLFKKKSKEKTADDLFEEKAFDIPDDLQKQIETLSEAGYLSHLIKYLELLQETTRKLSRLKITNDYRIYLMDYEMKEVKMTPLPKALYFLFLKHPQGISFKELTDYRTELLNIYKNISLRENPIKARMSIRKLTDPLDNSVHEKCSRIREAFLRVVADDIAQNYYITGDRGDDKKVLLDRELLIYEKQ